VNEKDLKSQKEKMKIQVKKDLVKQQNEIQIEYLERFNLLWRIYNG
jgi:hypothetical protein